MSHPLLDAAQKARQAVFDHAGFNAAYSYSALEDYTEMNWFMNGKDDIIYWSDDFTCYQSTLRRVDASDVYICIGEDFSIVLMESDFGGDPITGVFLNTKEVDELPPEIEDQL